MSDSYLKEYLPFKTSPELLDEYVYADGRIRTGKLLEDLDALAGAIAYKHIDNGDPDAPAVTVVTASVDRLDLFLPKAVENYKLSGMVTYAGNSSMEIFIKAETVSDEETGDADTDYISATTEDFGMLGPNTVLATRFTMVAIDSQTQKPVTVNPLKPTSPTEERLFDIAKANKKRKKRNAELSLTKQPPTPEERLTIHDIFLQYSQYSDVGDDSFVTSTSSDEKQPLPDNLMWMRDTRIESNFLMQPQDRNIHNNIFGGYLMRRAFELAFSDASLFMRSRSPILLAMDEVIFRRPVHVGSLLNLKAGIVHAEGYPHRSVQVRVVAEVVDIENGSRETTNIFYFTLASPDDKAKLKRILPKTYAETMLWLDAKRRRFQGVNARQLLLDELSPKHLSDDCEGSDDLKN
ncbi:HotDog domain-containing protein [Radiomyces spectabilis]|uniref:HotDog domain-containing protein n=1 Tax=Radiomyces spectabilis TaxID=64574 RepID=UPI00221F3754|nr:HotDog domain-containing protein [Radiomyces spectabilis]KAI8393482.1 HotDog domain-containing protein [Radiomyces spectabilis]